MDEEKTQTPDDIIEIAEVVKKPNYRAYYFAIFSIGLTLIATILTATFFYYRFKVETTKIVTIPSITASPSPLPTIGQVSDDSTADWKTYVSEEYQFSFSYPNNWNISESDQTWDLWDKVIAIKTSYQPNNYSIGSVVGQIHISKPYDNNNIPNLESYLYTTNQEEKTYTTYINNIPAIRNIPQSSETFETYYLVTEKENVVMSISLVVSDTQVKEKNISQVNQLLDSFTFLDESNSSQANNDYIDSEYNFKLILTDNIQTEKVQFTRTASKNSNQIIVTTNYNEDISTKTYTLYPALKTDKNDLENWWKSNFPIDINNKQVPNDYIVNEQTNFQDCILGTTTLESLPPLIEVSDKEENKNDNPMHVSIYSYYDFGKPFILHLEHTQDGVCNGDFFPILKALR